jgi:hypothetical protein
MQKKIKLQLLKIYLRNTATQHTNCKSMDFLISGFLSQDISKLHSAHTSFSKLASNNFHL